MKLFAYGTLRQSESNHNILINHATYQETCKTTEKYIMFTQKQRYFPFIIPVSFWPEMAHYATHITGDLYDVTEEGIQSCDEIEGHPDWYCRTPIFLETSEGEQQSFAYLLTEHGFMTERNDITILPSGDWIC
jgi:gamma-glutamylcyclotransferase (GGCT)/AIG2-like uncharacterized protein YtfP